MVNNIMIRYFRKDEPRVKLFLPQGSPLPFDFSDRNYGYVATQHGWLIHELEQAMTRGVGGITELTEEEYLDAQKKRRLNSSPRQRENVRPLPRAARRGGRAPWDVGVVGRANTAPANSPGLDDSPAVAKPQRPDGLMVQKQFVKPRVGKFPSFETAD